jgi:hypothetical protein
LACSWSRDEPVKLYRFVLGGGSGVGGEWEWERGVVINACDIGMLLGTGYAQIDRLAAIAVVAVSTTMRSSVPEPQHQPPPSGVPLLSRPTRLPRTQHKCSLIPHARANSQARSGSSSASHSTSSRSATRRRSSMADTRRSREHCVSTCGLVMCGKRSIEQGVNWAVVWSCD